jgi:hypothetical protein
MRSGFVLPLPRFVFHPLTCVVVAVVHVYLGLGHLANLFGGDVQWTHVWKGFGALGGAYVFAAIASRGLARTRESARSPAGRSMSTDSTAGAPAAPERPAAEPPPGRRLSREPAANP